jgi:hypothetical protein
LDLKKINVREFPNFYNKNIIVIETIYMCRPGADSRRARYLSKTCQEVYLLWMMEKDTMKSLIVISLNIWHHQVPVPYFIKLKRILYHRS